MEAHFTAEQTRDCHVCPGAGLGKDIWKGVQRKGRSAMACAEWRLEQGSIWIREGFLSVIMLGTE